MHSVGREIDGTPWTNKVVNPDAELRSEVEDTGSLLAGCWDGSHWRELVVRPDHSAGALNPRHPAATMEQIPTQNDGRDAYPRIRSAGGIRATALCRPPRHESASYTPERWRIRLPKRHHFDGIFKLAMQQAGAYRPRKNFSYVRTQVEEMIVGAIAGSEPAVGKSPILQWF